MNRPGSRLAALAAGTALVALTLAGPASAQSNGPIKIGVIAEATSGRRLLDPAGRAARRR